MTLLVIGINHKCSPIEIREKISFNTEYQLTLLHELTQYENISEAVILSTCNRTEIYTNSDTIDPILHTILNHSSITMQELEAGLYVHKDLAAIEHIMSVACGLDSLVLGEPQILGQVKQAYTDSRENKSVDASMEKLFQKSFSVAIS